MVGLHAQCQMRVISTTGYNKKKATPIIDTHSKKL
jgi:hypothetical protein